MNTTSPSTPAGILLIILLTSFGILVLFSLLCHKLHKKALPNQILIVIFEVVAVHRVMPIGIMEGAIPC